MVQDDGKGHVWTSTVGGACTDIHSGSGHVRTPTVGGGHVGTSSGRGACTNINSYTENVGELFFLKITNCYIESKWFCCSLLYNIPYV